MLAATNVAATRWDPTFPIVVGTHTWCVAAHVGGGVIGGPVTSFSVAGPAVTGTMGPVNLPATIKPGSTGSVVVTFDLSRLPAASAPIQVEIYASTRRDFGAPAVLLGKGTVSLGRRWRRQGHLTIPL